MEDDPWPEVPTIGHLADIEEAAARSCRAWRSGPRWRGPAGCRPWPAARSGSSARTSSAPARSSPRRLPAHLPALRRRAGAAASSRPPPATTPRASRSSAQLLGITLDGLHARGRADPQGQRHPGLRRRGDLPRAATSTRRSSPAKQFAERDRGGLHPPLRPRRHRRRAGHLRAGDPRAGARGADGPGPHRRRRAARRESRSRSRPSVPTSAWSASRPRARRRSRRRSPAGRPVQLESMRTMADGIAVGRPGDITFRGGAATTSTMWSPCPRTRWPRRCSPSWSAPSRSSSPPGRPPSRP